MAELVACLHHGKVEVLRSGQPSQRLESPFREQLAAPGAGRANARIVSVTRGRTSAELCYAISSGNASSVFVQVPGSARELRLFHNVAAQLSELDFSPADEALACTVAGAHGASAIGVLSDDGRGLRTVTEGDVIDCAPRWAPGGRAEIVYASAGIGRTKTGKAAGRSPFALHRLRFSDNSVEVLMADAEYDYAAVVPVSEGLLYALRRRYDARLPLSPFARFSGAFRDFLSAGVSSKPRALHSHELVRISTKGTHLLARGVLAFDVAANEDIVYSNEMGVFKISAGQPAAEPMCALARVEQLIIYG